MLVLVSGREVEAPRRQLHLAATVARDHRHHCWPSATALRRLAALTGARHPARLQRIVRRQSPCQLFVLRQIYAVSRRQRFSNSGV